MAQDIAMNRDNAGAIHLKSCVPLQPYARRLLEFLSQRVNERSGKGRVNPRVGLDRRAADVQQLYADPHGSNTITIPR